MNDVTSLGSSKKRSPDSVLALRERLIFLAEDFASSSGKFEYLENRTGISAASWEDLFLRRIAPDTDMILALALYRRDKIEWLLTGHTAALVLQKTPHAELWGEFRENNLTFPDVVVILQKTDFS